jgi:hypothetical protein
VKSRISSSIRSTGRLCGNPAAVVLLERFPASEILQAVAGENNLAQTAKRGRLSFEPPDLASRRGGRLA